ncbi:MAG: hypothetical protein BA869_09710 [Desulfuromonadales bacterium C00003107]|jgi:hypothetical protein|nr:MAG: hypothetical protein BA869_09710 [Desulfuromonadales bacterium C00003107]
MLPLMTLVHKKKERLTMIEQALQDQAPKTYRQLKAANKLPTFLTEHEALMMESFDQVMDAVLTAMQQVQRTDSLARMQTLTEKLSRGWQETLATYLEFSDETIA